MKKKMKIRHQHGRDSRSRHRQQIKSRQARAEQQKETRGTKKVAEKLKIAGAILAIVVSALTIILLSLQIAEEIVTFPIPA